MVDPLVSAFQGRVCDTGAGVIHGRDGFICHLPWSPKEMCRSSTRRELRAGHVLPR